MKKFFFLTLVVLTGIVSSCKYDDDELWDNVNDLANRLTTLEAAIKQMNSDIAAMQSIVTALQNQVSVSDVETLTDGYIIHFSDGTKATIRNGADGEDGLNAPIINVAQENGVYYWTITIDEETEWLTDASGNKMAVSGKNGSNGSNGADGKTPLLKVDAQGYWMVSYDNGSSYVRVKDANNQDVLAKGEIGDSKFKSIEEGNGVVVVTLTDGTQYELVMAASVTYTNEQGQEVSADGIVVALNSSVTLTYNVPQLGENYSVEILKQVGVEVTIDSGNKLTITAATSMIGAKVVILYYNATQTITSVLTFEEAWTEETMKVRMNSTYFSTIQEAVDAAQGEAVIEISAGEYAEVVKVTGGKNITIQPNTIGEGVSIAGLDHQSNGTPSTVVVKNITLDNTLQTEGWFIGTAQNIKPCVGAWGGNFTFEGCKFIIEGTSGKETGVMTWWTTAPVLSFKFDNCEFVGYNDHASARAMQIYGNVNMEVTNCTFKTYKEYSLKYVAKEDNVAIFKGNKVYNSKYFVQLGSALYAGSKYIANINSTTLGDGVSYYYIDNEEEQLVYIDEVCNVSTSKLLTYAVNKGVANIMLADGEYDVNGCGGKTLTISGSKNAVLKLTNEGEDGCDYGFGSAETGVGNYTFNGITIDTQNNTGNYKGYAYMKGTFNDCSFVGAYSLNNANDFVFKNCIFDFKNGYFWTWGANSVTFEGCTFNGNSKTILAHGSASTTINIKDCNFNATEKGYTGAGDNTAAVEIDPTATNTYTINFTGNNTKTEYYAGWTRIKDGSTGHTITGLE